MNIQQAARVALDCQDACNLSGVLASFKEIFNEVLWPEARRLGKGTEYVNTHPIVTLFLDKLASLNRTQCLCSDSMNATNAATDKVEQLARGESLDLAPELSANENGIAWG